MRERALTRPLAPVGVDPVGDRELGRGRASPGASRGRRGPRRAPRPARASGSTATWLTDAKRSTTPSSVEDAARGGTSPRAAARTRVAHRARCRAQRSWSRHGARFSTRSMIDQSASTQSTERSRAFQTSAEPPAGPDARGRARRSAPVGVEPVEGLRDGDRVERRRRRTGSASAVPATTGHVGQRVARARATCPRPARPRPGRRRVGASSAGELARSRRRGRSTATPGPRRRCSTIQATASAG